MDEVNHILSSSGSTESKPTKMSVVYLGNNVRKQECRTGGGHQGEREKQYRITPPSEPLLCGNWCLKSFIIHVSETKEESVYAPVGFLCPLVSGLHCHSSGSTCIEAEGNQGCLHKRSMASLNEM